MFHDFKRYYSNQNKFQGCLLWFCGNVTGMLGIALTVQMTLGHMVVFTVSLHLVTSGYCSRVPSSVSFIGVLRFSECRSFKSWLFYSQLFYSLGIIFFVSLSDSSLLAYRNTTNFCILILDPATLLNSFNSCNSFFGSVLRVFYVQQYVICRQWQLYFFLSNLYRFVSFSCPIATAGTCSTMLRVSGKSGHLCLFPYVMKCFRSALHC